MEKIWDALDIVRVYTKKRGSPPDLSDPLILTSGRHGKTVRGALLQIHKKLLEEFGGALVWGKSVKHNPQKCGLTHELCDEDVIQIEKAKVKKQVKQNTKTTGNKAGKGGKKK